MRTFNGTIAVLGGIRAAVHVIRSVGATEVAWADGKVEQRRRSLAVSTDWTPLAIDDIFSLVGIVKAWLALTFDEASGARHPCGRLRRALGARLGTHGIKRGIEVALLAWHT